MWESLRKYPAEKGDPWQSNMTANASLIKDVTGLTI